MTNFIIFTTQRSGSTVLTRTIDGHPEIFCAGELFHEINDIHHSEWHFPSWALSQKNKMLRKFDKIINYPNLRFRAIPHVKRFYMAIAAHEKARGFKLMITQIKTMPYVWDHLKKSDTKVIVLIRKNIFETALSRLRKDETRVAHVSGAKVENTKFRAAPAKLLKHMQNLEKGNQNLLDLTTGMDRVVIYYEDFGEWNTMLDKVFTFLNVSPLTLQPVLNKISGKDWKEEISNCEEIEKLLQQNNYTKYL